MSCLYRLQSRTPVDFLLTADADERAAALTHLGALSSGDVVVFDRGYFSYALLYTLVAHGVHPVFRIQRNAGAAFDAFMAGDQDDACVQVAPGRRTRYRLRTEMPGARCDPLDLRLLRYDAGGNRHMLATTLIDPAKYSLAELSELYHARWGIEELYKISKEVIAVEEFHGQTERGVRQELYAHFNLIAMTRLFSNRGDALLEQLRADGAERMQTNFRNALAMLAANLEEMVLTRTAALAETVSRMAERIIAVRYRLRPGRSYPRQSMKARRKVEPQGAGDGVTRQTPGEDSAASRPGITAAS